MRTAVKQKKRKVHRYNSAWIPIERVLEWYPWRKSRRGADATQAWCDMNNTAARWDWKGYAPVQQAACTEEPDLRRHCQTLLRLLLDKQRIEYESSMAWALPKKDCETLFWSHSVLSAFICWICLHLRNATGGILRLADAGLLGPSDTLAQVRTHVHACVRSLAYIHIPALVTVCICLICAVGASAWSSRRASVCTSRGQCHQ